jgi:hypothetical protein
VLVEELRSQSGFDRLIFVGIMVPGRTPQNINNIAGFIRGASCETYWAARCSGCSTEWVAATSRFMGFRATFKTWASERTNFAREVIEAALAHAISDKLEAAYRRGDFFEKRKRLMTAWAEFCARATPETGQLLRLKARV